MLEQELKGSKQDSNKGIRFPILSVDYGQKYIGLAISDMNGKISAPYDTLRKKKEKDFSDTIERIKQICLTEGIKGLLLGMPQAFTDEQIRSLTPIMEFGDRLSEATDLKVWYYDESFSTVEAEALLNENSKRSKKSGSVDKTSAAIFLQDFLDNFNAKK